LQLAWFRRLQTAMLLLTEFLLRMSFGLAAGLTLVSARQVTSGYFRNHLYVILGLSSLAALLSRTIESAAFWPAVLAAALSYIGSVCWLYEKPAAGKAALVLIAITAFIAALQANGFSMNNDVPYLHGIQVLTSGLLLGVTMAAMLLGHWYLNAPGMELAPLKKLLITMSVAVTVHAILCGVGLALEAAGHPLSTQDWLFVVLRWSFGFAGVLILTWLAWRTLAIPNTQSATGILYVAVIGAFVGETMSLLLSAQSVYPV
jgi:hypothetical protein